MQTIDKLRKFAEGGKVKKYQDGQIMQGGDLTDLEKEELAKIEARRAKRQARHQNFIQGFGGEDAFSKENWKGTAMQMGGAAIDIVDNALVGDKNFGAQSEAIDGAVDMASEALMKSGNPYAMGAALALKGANFLTKAGGQTVQGFDVDINSSGYGNLGHMESSSSRDFSAALGPLGAIFTGVNQSKMQAKLKKRNDQMRMAMDAANIANEQSFEQEARMNSVQNTIMNNQIALAGGMDTSLLGG